MRFPLRFALVSAAVVGLVVPVHAAEPATSPALGDDGQFILSAERLFGVNHTTYKSGDSNETLTNFRMTAFWSQPPELETIPNPAAIPRLAGDFVVAPNLTVGAALGVAYSSFASDGRSAQKNFALLASPRVGYVVGLGGSARLWLRGGITYFRSNMEERNDNTTWSQVSVTLEPTFVIPLASNVAFSIAPLADIPISGRIKDDNDSEKLTSMTLGANIGLIGYF